MSQPIFILGGHQTDFAYNWSKNGGGLFEIMGATVNGALEATGLDPEEIGVTHVANFTGELFGKQGQLGGLFSALHPAFDGVPSSRHEAACASGGVAVLAAAADLEAGRYDVACVVGVEQERNVPGGQAADYLGVAAWLAEEAQEAKYPWPYLFGQLAEEYRRRYGLEHHHLAAIGRQNFTNARKNPNAQTRNWTFTDKSFTEDAEANPLVEGCIRRQDCSQITDGGATVILANEKFAKKWAARRDIPLDKVPRLMGWGHVTSTMTFEAKMEKSRGTPYIFPGVKKAIGDALRRAEVADVYGLDLIETHDCFSITEYMAIDHFGLTPPGQSYRAIEDGTIGPNGKLPINPSGGLMGGGHPVGASGVRMVLDAQKQVTGQAGEYQVVGAKKVGLLNLGGTATTVVSMVVGVN